MKKKITIIIIIFILIVIIIGLYFFFRQKQANYYATIAGTEKRLCVPGDTKKDYQYNVYRCIINKDPNLIIYEKYENYKDKFDWSSLTYYDYRGNVLCNGGGLSLNDCGTALKKWNRKIEWDNNIKDLGGAINCQQICGN